MANTIQEKMDEYFSSINPTSKRMMEDLNVIKTEQGDKWNTLTLQQQEQVLWKALVSPTIESKFQKPLETSDIECFPVLRLKPGAKVIVDEDTSAGKSFGSTWRDEHSAPFRWETQSQLNLTFCTNDGKKDKNNEIILRPVVGSSNDVTVEEKKEEESKRPLAIKRPEVPPPPVPPHATPPSHKRSHTLPASVIIRHTEQMEIPIYAKVVKRKSATKSLPLSEMKTLRKVAIEIKPAVPPRMSLELKVDVNDPKYKSLESINTDGIPKTGFDFLDNW